MGLCKLQRTSWKEVNDLDAKLRKIVVTPAKFDDEGEIKSEEFATLTLDVPMDSKAQRAAIMELMDLLDQEWVTAEVQRRLQQMKVAS